MDFSFPCFPSKVTFPVVIIELCSFSLNPEENPFYSLKISNQSLLFT